MDTSLNLVDMKKKRKLQTAICSCEQYFHIKLRKCQASKYINELIGKWDTSFGSGRRVCGNLPKNGKHKKHELDSKLTTYLC